MNRDECLTAYPNLEGANLEGAILWGANLEEANLWGANLEEANLWGANLEGANLRGATLEGANLRGANLEGANLRGTNLRGANLWGANLEGANLEGANLRGAVLRGANLWGANLRGANLEGANLWGAILRGANLWGANLRGANNIPAIVAARLLVPPEIGEFTFYKKLRDGTICKLRCPVDAKRSSATTRKLRVEFAEVLEGEGYSVYSSSFHYKPGLVVRCRVWNPDRWVECGGGIHGFLTRVEAEEYTL